MQAELREYESQSWLRAIDKFKVHIERMNTNQNSGKIRQMCISYEIHEQGFIEVYCGNMANKYFDNGFLALMEVDCERLSAI